MTTIHVFTLQLTNIDVEDRWLSKNTMQHWWHSVAPNTSRSKKTISVSYIFHIYIYTYNHTHTYIYHTHTYIYIYFIYLQQTARPWRCASKDRSRSPSPSPHHGSGWETGDGNAWAGAPRSVANSGATGAVARWEVDFQLEIWRNNEN